MARGPFTVWLLSPAQTLATHLSHACQLSSLHTHCSLCLNAPQFCALETPWSSVRVLFTVDYTPASPVLCDPGTGSLLLCQPCSLIYSTILFLGANVPRGQQTCSTILFLLLHILGYIIIFCILLPIKSSTPLFIRLVPNQKC